MIAMIGISQIITRLTLQSSSSTSYTLASSKMNPTHMSQPEERAKLQNSLISHVMPCTLGRFGWHGVEEWQPTYEVEVSQDGKGRCVRCAGHPELGRHVKHWQT